MKPKTPFLKKMDIAAYIISVLVLFSVGGRFKIDTDIDFTWLAPFHAAVNAFTAVVLVYALVQIKKKNITAHRNAIYVSMVASFFFLVSYLTYHATTEETKFCMEGAIRYVYFFILITHIVLAGLSLPFILLTFNRGYTRHDARHRKLAKWVMPLWIYIAITGPIVYLMLFPCYQ